MIFEANPDYNIKQRISRKLSGVNSEKWECKQVGTAE